MAPALAAPDVALIGCGRWGANILRDLLQLGCHVTVVAQSAESRARATAGGASRLVSSVEDVHGVAGVVVATPTSTHVDVIDQILALGVPVYVEKPVATDLEIARRLAATVADRVFVMHKWRYHVGVQRLAELAQGGAVGRVEGLALTRTQWLTHHSDVDALWTLLPHDLSITQAVLGHVPAPRAAAGRGASVFAILGQSPWVHLQVGSRFGRDERRAELYGTEGTAVLSSAYDDEILVLRGDDTAPPQEQRVTCAGEWPLLRQLRAFVEHLGGGPPPMSNLHDEVAIIDAIVTMRRMAECP